MNKTPSVPQEINYLHRHLFVEDFDKVPKLNPRYFVVLAMVDVGYSQNQVVEYFDGKISHTTIFTILAEACERGLAKFKRHGDDREFILTFKGKQFLNSYATLMRLME